MDEQKPLTTVQADHNSSSDEVVNNGAKGMRWGAPVAALTSACGHTHPYCGLTTPLPTECARSHSCWYQHSVSSSSL